MHCEIGFWSRLLFSYCFLSQLIKPESLPNLFKSSFESEYLTSMLAVFQEFYIPYARQRMRILWCYQRNNPTKDANSLPLLFLRFEIALRNPRFFTVPLLAWSRFRELICHWCSWQRARKKVPKENSPQIDLPKDTEMQELFLLNMALHFPLIS